VGGQFTVISKESRDNSSLFPDCLFAP